MTASSLMAAAAWYVPAPTQIVWLASATTACGQAGNDTLFGDRGPDVLNGGRRTDPAAAR